MRIVSAALFISICLSVFVSCSKEKSFEVEASAIGSLKSDNTGNCLPKTAVGAFVAGSALSDSNYLVIDVDVAKVGSYAIRTDSVNGYSFSGMGNFDKTGINQVRLAASGTPTVAGQDEFTVIFDSSFCFMPVTVLPAGSSGPAAFTLEGSGDSCIIAAVSGNYVQNVPLGASNTVAIKVNATTSGTYTLTTNRVNEFSFSGTGTIAAPGENTIVLTATGTPATEGSTVFTVTAGNTTCTFAVTITASNVPPPVATGDLFPLTRNSRWSYAYDPSAPNDTLEVTNVGTVTFAGNTYQNFEYTDPDKAFDSFYYRKNGNDYLEYVDVSNLIEDLETDVKGDVLFLKENLTKNDTWNTDFATKINGSDVTLRFSFTCTEANTTTTVNGKSFAGVYKVTMKLQSGAGGAFADVGPVIETYYAKGVGLIYEKGNEAAGDFERQIKNYEVK